ncbi:unnamed protein product [Schistosoma curassoni]|uniref:DUF5641 domain-containing protein n=1 Tax=Schistosoma curassoni TaxID=6186 RepID=A0A183JXK4_9TREM|nr:unnamed protein product [Schistosoma curassoni]
MVVGGSRQETLNPGFVLLGTSQQGVPVILRELVPHCNLVDSRYTCTNRLWKHRWTQVYGKATLEVTGSKLWNRSIDVLNDNKKYLVRMGTSTEHKAAHRTRFSRI